MKRTGRKIGLHPAIIDLRGKEAWLLSPSRTALEVFRDLFRNTFQAGISPITEPDLGLTLLWKKAIHGAVLEDDTRRVVVTLGDRVEVKVVGQGPLTLSLKNPDQEAVQMAGRLLDRQNGRVTGLRLCIGLEDEEGDPVVGFAGLKEGRPALDLEIIPDGTPAAAPAATRRILQALDDVLAGAESLLPVQEVFDLAEREIFLEAMRQARQA